MEGGGGRPWRAACSTMAGRSAAAHLHEVGEPFDVRLEHSARASSIAFTSRRVRRLRKAARARGRWCQWRREAWWRACGAPAAAPRRGAAPWPAPPCRRVPRRRRARRSVPARQQEQSEGEHQRLERWRAATRPFDREAETSSRAQPPSRLPVSTGPAFQLRRRCRPRGRGRRPAAAACPSPGSGCP